MTRLPPSPASLADLGHELRTPLAAVIGYADAMRGQALGPLSPAYVAAADAMLAAARHMLELADRLMSPADAAGAVFDAKDVFAETIRMLRADPRATRVSLTLRAPSEPTLVRADPLALRQIAVNLIANALAATSGGGSVAVGLTVESTDLVILIDDDGPGVAPDAAGQGLSIVRSLTAALGGELSLGRSASGGARASVRLPIVETA